MRPADRIAIAQIAPLRVAAERTVHAGRFWWLLIAVSPHPFQTVAAAHSPLDQRIAVHNEIHTRLPHPHRLVGADTDPLLGRTRRYMAAAPEAELPTYFLPNRPQLVIAGALALAQAASRNVERNASRVLACKHARDQVAIAHGMHRER